MDDPIGGPGARSGMLPVVFSSVGWTVVLSAKSSVLDLDFKYVADCGRVVAVCRIDSDCLMVQSCVDGCVLG